MFPGPKLALLLRLRAVAICLLPIMAASLLLALLSSPRAASLVALAATSEAPTPTLPAATETPTDVPTATATATKTPTATSSPAASATPETELSLESYRRLLLPLAFAPAAPAEAEPTPTATDAPTPIPTAALAPTPGPTPDCQARQVIVPVLMYHHVAERDPSYSYLRRSLTVSPRSFRWQLDYLRANGYESVKLDDLVAYLAMGQPLPPKPVVITFDDGYRDNYEVAFPMLRERGFVATFFLVTAPIDEGSPEFMTWEQVKEMHAAGMEFGAHSYTHPDLRGQSVDYLVWQVVGSKEAIEERTGEPVRFFAYPSGSYDDQVIAVLKSAGFWAALSTETGCLHSLESPWSLDRVRVSPQDGESKFAEKLIGCTG